MLLKLCCFLFFLQPGTSSRADDSQASEGKENQTAVPEDISDFYKKIDQEEEDDEVDLSIVSYEINQVHLERLQKR